MTVPKSRKPIAVKHGDTGLQPGARVVVDRIGANVQTAEVDATKPQRRAPNSFGGTTEGRRKGGGYTA